MTRFPYEASSSVAKLEACYHPPHHMITGLAEISFQTTVKESRGKSWPMQKFRMTL
jgi:hypothetical protein